MKLEAAGVPTVSIHTHVFARLVKATAQANGMPTVRQVFVPQPIVGKSAAELRACIEGEDPVHKRPFLHGVLEGLSGGLTDADRKGLSFDRSTPRFLAPDTEENLHRLFMDQRWTDCLPVVLPTEERVAAMLHGISQPPDRIVGQLSPASFREEWAFDVEKVAVNAVMAGARPEYLPVILALAASGMTARSSSTTSWSTIAVVNGPIRKEIGMSAGIGAMGPWNHANTAIGRAYCLLSQNLQGGSVPEETYMGSLGNWYSYSAAFPENEERSPWEPYHVQHGFKPEDSTVSVFLGGWYTQAGFGPRDTWEQKFRHCLAACEPFIGPIIVLDPLVAKGFVERGMDTKQKLIRWCVENARLTAREYWDNQWSQTLLRPYAVAGIEPYASRLKAPPDEMIRMFEEDQIHVVVTGGETQGAWKMISGLRRGKGTISVDEWR